MKDTITNLVDIHNHSLPNVDDGAKNIDEAISNLIYISGMGYTDIVLTSHYIVNSKYESNVEKRTKILEELQKKVPKGINLYLGNEVYISEAEEIIKLLKTKEITYILIEFPLNYEIHYLDRLLCELKEAGLIPIIAHPERYTYFQRKYQKINKVLDFHCYLQVNLESLSGKYGKKAKKYAKYLLRKGMVSFLATDMHNLNHKGI